MNQNTNLDRTLHFPFVVRVWAFPTLRLALKVPHVVFLLSILLVFIRIWPSTFLLILWHIIAVPAWWGVTWRLGTSDRSRPSLWRGIYRSDLLGWAGRRCFLLSVSILTPTWRTWRWSPSLFFLSITLLRGRTRRGRLCCKPFRCFPFSLWISWRSFIWMMWTGGWLPHFPTSGWWTWCRSPSWWMTRCILFSPGACSGFRRRGLFYCAWRLRLTLNSRAGMWPRSLIFRASPGACPSFFRVLIWTGNFPVPRRWLNPTFV